MKLNLTEWATEKSMIEAWAGLELKEINPEDVFYILFEISEERRKGEIHTKNEGIVFADVIKGILVKRMNEALGGNPFKYGEWITFMRAGIFKSNERYENTS